MNDLDDDSRPVAWQFEIGGTSNVVDQVDEARLTAIKLAVEAIVAQNEAIQLLAGHTELLIRAALDAGIPEEQIADRAELRLSVLKQFAAGNQELFPRGFPK